MARRSLMLCQPTTGVTAITSAPGRQAAPDNPAAFAPSSNKPSWSLDDTGGHDSLSTESRSVMKRILALFLLIASTLTIAETNNTSASADLSPAGRSIAEARKAIEKKPTQYSGYNLLAMALARRARETSDVGFYAQAEDALKRSLDLAPGNLDGEKIHVWLLLGRHEFAAALDAAKALNKRVPDDVLYIWLPHRRQCRTR